MKKIVKFYRIYPTAMPPMRADKTALGTLPAAAYQYCEPVRTASAFGWYIFPPADIYLKWSGSETLCRVDGAWQALTSQLLDGDFLNYWDMHVPDALKGRAPPFLSSLFVPGIVQIWSGFFVSTAEDWAVLIRPLANILPSASFVPYEGLIESDYFAPCPLFINIRLISTEREIFISKLKPLFQVQPIHRECYSEGTLGQGSSNENSSDHTDVFGMSKADWDGFRGTIRDINPEDDEHHTGSYGAAVRRRAKRDGQRNAAGRAPASAE